MPSDKKQINARVTEDEYNALSELMILLKKSQAETIRYCVRKICQQYGIEINETMPKPGTYNREPRVLSDDERLTEYYDQQERNRRYEEAPEVYDE